MPTNNHTARPWSWIRRLKARLFDGPEVDQAMHQLYCWARAQKMPTGVRQPGLRVASTVAGEVASARCRQDRPSDPALPTVLVDDQVLEAPETLEAVLERELGSPERRRDPRLPFTRLVRYSDGQVFATGGIVNVSGTGLLIEAAVLLPMGTVIAGAFRSETEPQGRVVGFRGRVVRHVKDRDGGRMGIELTRMIAVHRQELEQIIDRLARNGRRDPTLRGWKAAG
jgi:hypothetical protein